jgi:hypothetical protein
MTALQVSGLDRPAPLERVNSLVLADINPIGGISKTDLKAFISYARDAFELPVLDR